MKPVQLDFQRKPSTTPWIGLVLVALGVVVILWALAQQDIVRQRQQQVSDREDDVAWLKKKQDQAQQAARKETPMNDKVAAIRKGQLVSPIPALALLEEYWSNDIGLTKLEVVTADHDIKLELESRTLEDTLSLVDNLTSDPRVSKVTFAHQGLKVVDPFKPTQSQLEFTWREVRR
ncbi:hypothetical protein [Amantichitinum ursilacus]|uniref:Fimbrial assembly protein (PilN) n=1 Tax=Amantichitinum ursilacus TaxID=857265 RepID=A0A0N0XKR1_9NEIS|nr:hypothetical protein [Amantichitinum ursilacus]KPC54449.1 hypothetical protein WG78_02695 [Amantichitinum ursilacus]